jgi:hypothetical protein
MGSRICWSRVTNTLNWGRKYYELAANSVPVVLSEMVSFQLFVIRTFLVQGVQNFVNLKNI